MYGNVKDFMAGCKKMIIASVQRFTLPLINGKLWEWAG